MSALRRSWEVVGTSSGSIEMGCRVGLLPSVVVLAHGEQELRSPGMLGKTVTVPETLRVSEANRYLPGGDIVWRGDPIGNRHEQVKAILTAGLGQGVADFAGEREVILDVVLTRFHALTEKARYTIGGVHAIQFNLQVRDAATGEMVLAPRRIKADFDALGGSAAVAAEAQGVTQKVRITNHLAYVIQQELGRPEGYAVRDNGLVGAINQL